MSLRDRARDALGGGAQLIRIGEADAVGAYFATLDIPSLDAAEIAGSGEGAAQGWRSFTVLEYPDFDLCAPPDHVPTYDVVRCEHVLEHVVDPVKAADTLFKIVRPGGHLVVITPFLIKVHNCPRDLWRFTEDGLRTLLGNAGFRIVESGGWGNPWLVAANLRLFVRDR